MALTIKYQKAYDRIRETVCGGSVWRFLLSEVVYELKNAFPKYGWVGIYLLKDDILHLETFLGKPTEHIKIKISEGICGTAVREARTLLVGDVKKDDRYISCDIAVKSEIVVLIKHNEKIIGVLDIDSNLKAAFNEQDQEFLELVANLLASSCPKITSSH